MSIKLSSQEEKMFLQSVCQMSSQSEDVVKDVLKSTLLTIVANLYSDITEFTIPYLMKVAISYEDELTTKGCATKVSIQAEPTSSFYEEIKAINEGEEPPSMIDIEDRIGKKLEEKVNLF